jgi:hypothetical protein
MRLATDVAVEFSRAKDVSALVTDPHLRDHAATADGRRHPIAWLPQQRSELEGEAWGEARPGRLSLVRAVIRLDTRNDAQAAAVP